MENRQLRRNRNDRILGGVASGLARMINVDPVFVRLGFLFLALINGFGLLVYLAMWLLVPADDSYETDPRAQMRENINDMQHVAEEYAARVRKVFAAPNQ
jgi:phage shock protein C